MGPSNPDKNKRQGLRENVKHKKTCVNPSIPDFAKHLREIQQEAMANDRQIILLAYGSNGVSRVEMGRLLASGPATDLLIYRELIKVSKERC